MVASSPRIFRSRYRQKRVVSIVAVLLSLACASILPAAEKAYIKLALDGGEVFFGDTVVLEVESTGLLDPIDFTVVDQHAELLRETTGTRIAVIGGKVSEIAIRRMDLIPKRPGVLVIGPLTAGEVTSNSVHIKILDAVRPNWQPEPNDIQIKTEISPASLMVNQQALLSVELLHRYPINNESITLPSLDGYAKRTVLNDRRTFAGNNREWYRTQYQYLIYPRQSGKQSLGKVQWSGNIAKSRVERADFNRNSEELTMEVTATPPEIKGWWLPSSNIELTEAWSEPPTSLKAGDELERTIIVKADDVLPGQIPALQVPESRALAQTLINTSRSEKLIDNRTQSSAAFTYRVKAQSPIPVFLDTVRLAWWDTDANEAREAIIPARRINVGLPERADILSKLALQETGASRLKHRLQSTGWLRMGFYTLALFSSLILSFIAIRLLTRRSRRTSNIRTHLAKLRVAANQKDTGELYRLLKSPVANELFGDAHNQLVELLENKMFSSNVSPHDAAMPSAIHQQLNKLEQTAEKTNTTTRASHQPALAEI